MNICTQPIGHTGRCRDAHGRTWDNNHPATQREADALAIAATVVAQRDAARAALDRLQRGNQILDALATLVTLHLDTDEWGPVEHLAGENAAQALAPLFAGATT